MNSDHRLGRWIIFLHRDPVRKHGGGFLTGTLKERELLKMGISTGAPLGNLGRGVHL
jgi:hypothetical protein